MVCLVTARGGVALAALFVVRNTARLAFVPLYVLAGFPFTCRSEMPDAKSEKAGSLQGFSVALAA